jgi:carboxyl-terminal processing protease
MSLHMANRAGRKLRTSHLGFFHSGARRASSRAALSASYLADDTPYGNRWIFQNVHSGGAADLAGIQPGNILLRVDGREIVPPENPVFAMGTQTMIDFVANDDQAAVSQVRFTRALRRGGPCRLGTGSTRRRY